MSKISTPQKIGWLLLAFLATAGLWYGLFLKGYLPGIYPFAVAYTTLFWMPNALLGLAIVYLGSILTVLAIVCGVLALSTRRRIDRRAIAGMAMLVCTALVLFPAWIGFDTGSSFLVEPWVQRYRRGIFCRQVHRFGGYIGILDDLTQFIIPRAIDSVSKMVMWRCTFALGPKSSVATIMPMPSRISTVLSIRKPRSHRSQFPRLS